MINNANDRGGKHAFASSKVGKLALACVFVTCALACSSDKNNSGGSGTGLAGFGAGTGFGGSAGFGVSGTSAGAAGFGAGTFAAGSGGVSGAPAGTGGTSAAGTDGASGTAAGTGVAGTDSGAGGTAAGGGGTGGGGSTWPAATGGFDKMGTFPTTSEAGGAACTIYRPMTLGEEGRLHPVLVWGNGTGTGPTSYTALFTHLASHGFIVAAANTSNAGSGKEMIACLDWVFMQNDGTGAYQGKVDKNNAGVMGYSQGGAGTLEAALDPRFKVSLPVSPYVVTSLGGYDESSAGKQKIPMFMISGSADTVAVPGSNQMPIYTQAAAVPIVWATFAGATHFEVIGAGGNYVGPITAWFRFQLMGDASAGDWFKDPTCTLCKTTGWTVMPNAMWKALP